MPYKNPAWFTADDIHVNQEHIKAMPQIRRSMGMPTWQLRDRDANPTPPPGAWQRFLLRYFL